MAIFKVKVGISLGEWDGDGDERRRGEGGGDGMRGASPWDDSDSLFGELDLSLPSKDENCGMLNVPTDKEEGECIGNRELAV